MKCGCSLGRLAAEYDRSKASLSSAVLFNTFKSCFSFQKGAIERISFVLTKTTKQCKQDAEASRLKLLMSEVPQRWVQCKDAGTQFSAPLYSDPNTCSFGYLSLGWFFFVSFSISILTFPCPFAHPFSHAPGTSDLLCPYLLILQLFRPLLSLLHFSLPLLCYPSLPVFITIISLTVHQSRLICTLCSCGTIMYFLLYSIFRHRRM